MKIEELMSLIAAAGDVHNKDTAEISHLMENNVELRSQVELFQTCLFHV